MREPLLIKETFWQVIQAFKRDPKFITKKEFNKIKKLDDFIPISKYGGKFFIKTNEVGIVGMTRLILNDIV